MKEIVSIAAKEDIKIVFPQALLNKYNCYKRETNFTLLKKTGLRVLATCHYLPQHEAEIFKV